MKTAWVCLSLGQENTGYLKTWIRVSELSGTLGREASAWERSWKRKEAAWWDSSGPGLQQARCRPRLSLWWAPSCHPQHTFHQALSLLSSKIHIHRFCNYSLSRFPNTGLGEDCLVLGHLLSLTMWSPEFDPRTTKSTKQHICKSPKRKGTVLGLWSRSF